MIELAFRVERLREEKIGDIFHERIRDYWFSKGEYTTNNDEK